MYKGYKEYPFLRVTQVYERLKGYGYSGDYDTVKDAKVLWSVIAYNIRVMIGFMLEKLMAQPQ